MMKHHLASDETMTQVMQAMEFYFFLVKCSQGRRAKLDLGRAHQQVCMGGSGWAFAIQTL